MTAEAESYDGWYLVEQMGHKRLPGYLRQVTIAGAGLLRVDVPSDPPVTQIIHPSTLYALTPIDEALARALAARYKPEPVSRYELAALLPSKPIEAALEAASAARPAYVDGVGSVEWADDGEGDPYDREDDA